MIHDRLDDLLDRSAPNSAPAAKADLDAMIAEAHQHAPRRRRPRTMVTTGVIAAFLVGGVGVAAATDGFTTWGAGVQNPERAVEFTMSNGFACELRVSDFYSGTDPLFMHQVNGTLGEWYRSSDALSQIEAFVPERLEGLGPIELNPGETLETLPPGEGNHRQWTLEWQAWDLAISDAEAAELACQGIPPGDERFEGAERNGQIQCLDKSGELYVPGSEQ